jgi:hypothetical protein
MDKLSNSLINCVINDKTYFVSKGFTILQACEEVGLTIPRFCYHDKLSIAGNCRMCLVQLDKSAKPVASCALEVSSGMKIYTNTTLVKRAREGVMEFLLANHPLDCPICDQGGECDLQDQALIFGNDRGRFYEIKRAVIDKDWGHLIKTVMTRCIHCTRCQRFSSELSGRSEIAMVGRGGKSEITNFLGNLLLSEVSGNVIDLCPVGALTSKPYAFTARPWELSHIQHLDLTDSMGSNLSLHVAGQRVFRVLPIVNATLNEEWLSDRARFSYDGFRLQRLLSPLVLFDGSKMIRASWSKITQSIVFASGPFIPFSLILGELSLEVGYSLSTFVTFRRTAPRYHDSRSLFSFNTAYSTFSKSDFCLLVGTPLKGDLPLLLLRLRFEQARRPLTILTIGTHDLGLGSISLGGTFFHLLLFLRGAHPLSPLFKRAFSPQILISGLLPSFSLSCCAVELIRNLAYLGNKTATVSNLFPAPLSATVGGEFGLFSSYPSSHRSASLFVVNSTDHIKTGVKHYQGHVLTPYGGVNLDSAATTYTYPVVTSFEVKSHYLNGQGRVQLGRRVFLNRAAFPSSLFFDYFNELMGLPYRSLNAALDLRLNEHVSTSFAIATSCGVYNYVNLPFFVIEYSAYRSTPVTRVSPLLSRSFEVEQGSLLYSFPR